MPNMLKRNPPAQATPPRQGKSFAGRLDRLESQQPAPTDKKYYYGMRYEPDELNPNGYTVTRMDGRIVMENGRIRYAPRFTDERIHFETRAALDAFAARPDVDLFSVVLEYATPQQVTP
jgi:hypothetical protein